MRNQNVGLVVWLALPLYLTACTSDNDPVSAKPAAAGSSASAGRSSANAAAGNSASDGGDKSSAAGNSATAGTDTGSAAAGNSSAAGSSAGNSVAGQSAAAGNAAVRPIEGWPIANSVFTTVQQQVLPFSLPADTPPINPSDVSLYGEFGYSAWHRGAGAPYSLRSELAPGHTDAHNAARLLSFFAISDIHITDKESPGEAINPGWSLMYGQNYFGLMAQAYSPVMLSTTQVLDAAVQTINVLHQKLRFDFGISLGDVTNCTQYNELRWYIDVLDGKVITPSSGAHAGADTIDYQRPFQAAGLDKSIPWYQAIGNHDQYWMGMLYDNAKTQAAHVGSTILDIHFDLLDPDFINSTGEYMGVVDGSTPYGNVIGAGPEANFPTPPTVIADPNRHSLVTAESSSKNWMREFLTTTSNPVGHGFTQINVDNDFASYTFEPRSDLPLKVIVLDDTCKKSDAPTNARYFGSGCLDQVRLDWLRSELQKGQVEGKLMIIGAHIPIKPQASLADNTPSYDFYDKAAEDALLAILHSYSNLVLWIAGHRHLNTVTAQPNNQADLSDHPEQSFWEVETASLRDFPQQLRTFELRRNSDNTLSILVTNIDPAVTEGSPAAKSRGYAIGVERLYGPTGHNLTLTDSTSHAYNAELVKQLSPEMQAKLANYGSTIQ